MAFDEDAGLQAEEVNRDHFIIQKGRKYYVCPIALIYDFDKVRPGSEEERGCNLIKALFEGVEYSANDGTKRIGYQQLMASGCVNTGQ